MQISAICGSYSDLSYLRFRKKTQSLLRSLMLTKQKIRVSEMSGASDKYKGEPAEELSAEKTFLHRQELGFLKLLALISLSDGCVITLELLSKHTSVWKGTCKECRYSCISVATGVLDTALFSDLDLRVVTHNDRRYDEVCQNSSVQSRGDGTSWYKSNCESYLYLYTYIPYIKKRV